MFDVVSCICFKTFLLWEVLGEAPGRYSERLLRRFWGLLEPSYGPSGVRSKVFGATCFPQQLPEQTLATDLARGGAWEVLEAFWDLFGTVLRVILGQVRSFLGQLASLSSSPSRLLQRTLLREVLGKALGAILGPFGTILRAIWGQVKDFGGNLPSPSSYPSRPLQQTLLGEVLGEGIVAISGSFLDPSWRSS